MSANNTARSRNKRTNNQRNSSQIQLQRQELLLLRKLVALEQAGSPPPQWSAIQPMSRSVRWSAAADQGETDFTVRNLLYAACSASSTTVLYPLAYACKLKRVQIWFTSSAVGTNKSAELEWNSASTGFLNPGTAVSATSSNPSDWAYLTARPPKDTLGKWYEAGVTGATNVLFSFSLPAGGIIQADFDWVPNVGEAVYESQTSSGLVTGTIYCRNINANIAALAPLNSAP